MYHYGKRNDDFFPVIFSTHNYRFISLLFIYLLYIEEHDIFSGKQGGEFLQAMREIQFIKESNTHEPRDFFRVNAFFLWKNLFFRLKESHRWDFTCRSSLRLSVPTGGYLNHRAVGKEMLLFWRQSVFYPLRVFALKKCHSWFFCLRSALTLWYRLFLKREAFPRPVNDGIQSFGCWRR